MNDIQKVHYQDLGSMRFKDAWDYQESLLAENVAIKALKHGSGETLTVPGTATDTTHHLLFVEHPPVYTLGKSGSMNNVLISEEDRIKNGIDFFKINRGGDITFHGPGQLVVYPVLDLEKFDTDIGKYLRRLEEVVIRTMADYGLHGTRSAGETGVWIDPDVKGRERKICAIGIRCSRWITMHGLAFNINTDLGYFNNIIPCGIHDKQVTSLARELGHQVSMEKVKSRVQHHFQEVFGICLLKVARDKKSMPLL